MRVFASNPNYTFFILLNTTISASILDVSTPTDAPPAPTAARTIHCEDVGIMMVAAARIGKDRDGDGDVIVATMVLFMPTTTIPGRDRCIKDGATSDGLLMIMLGVAKIAPRGRVTSTKLLRRWITWCGGGGRRRIALLNRIAIAADRQY